MMDTHGIQSLFAGVRDGCVGVYGDVAVLTCRDLEEDEPSALTPLVGRLAPEQPACAVFMHSVVDWYAFAVWDRGTLVRSFSSSYGDGAVGRIGNAGDDPVR